MVYSNSLLSVNGNKGSSMKITVRGPSKAQLQRAIREAERKLKRRIEREVRSKTGKRVKWVNK